LHERANATSASVVTAGPPAPERPHTDLVAAAPAISAEEVGAARRYADAGSAPLTVGHRLAAIGWTHRGAGLQPPQARKGDAAILEVMAGIRRSHGVAPARKHVADTDVLRDVLRCIPDDDLRSVRDRALLAFGMAGTFRRFELVALPMDDVA